MNLQSPGSPAIFAEGRRATASLFLAALLCGCADTPNTNALSTLPPETFVSNLSGYSNLGLWNRRLAAGLPNESDLYIRVDRTVPFDRVKTGDIIVFSQPGHARLICHPVVATGNGWVQTKGHFNDQCDAWLVTQNRFAGRVNGVSPSPTGPWSRVTNTRTPAIPENRRSVANSGRLYARADDRSVR